MSFKKLLSFSIIGLILIGEISGFLIQFPSSRARYNSPLDTSPHTQNLLYPCNRDQTQHKKDLDTKIHNSRNHESKRPLFSRIFSNQSVIFLKKTFFCYFTSYLMFLLSIFVHSRPSHAKLQASPLIAQSKVQRFATDTNLVS